MYVPDIAEVPETCHGGGRRSSRCRYGALRSPSAILNHTRIGELCCGSCPAVRAAHMVHRMLFLIPFFCLHYPETPKCEVTMGFLHNHHKKCGMLGPDSSLRIDTPKHPYFSGIPHVSTSTAAERPSTTQLPVIHTSYLSKSLGDSATVTRVSNNYPSSHDPKHRWETEASQMGEGPKVRKKKNRRKTRRVKQL